VLSAKGPCFSAPSGRFLRANPNFTEDPTQYQRCTDG
jgi:hypothetical protein